MSATALDGELATRSHRPSRRPRHRAPPRRWWPCGAGRRRSRSSCWSRVSGARSTTSTRWTRRWPTRRRSGPRPIRLEGTVVPGSVYHQTASRRCLRGGSEGSSKTVAVRRYAGSPPASSSSRTSRWSWSATSPPERPSNVFESNQIDGEALGVLHRRPSTTRVTRDERVGPLIPSLRPGPRQPRQKSRVDAVNADPRPRSACGSGFRCGRRSSGWPWSAASLYRQPKGDGEAGAGNGPGPVGPGGTARRPPLRARSSCSVGARGWSRSPWSTPSSPTTSRWSSWPTTTARATPLIYSITGLWSALAGSILLWGRGPGRLHLGRPGLALSARQGDRRRRGPLGDARHVRGVRLFLRPHGWVRPIPFLTVPGMA